MDSFEKRGIYQLTERFFLHYLKPGQVIVDVGANIGYYTLLSAEKVGPSGHVYAFEAHPKSYKYLNKNISLNGYKNVVSVQTALGDKLGKIKFSNQSKDDMNSVSVDGGIEVPLDLLDNHLISVKKIDLLKVDVEGYEKFVLLGARGTLDVTDTVFFEAWDDHFSKYDYSLQDVFSILEPYGFSYFVNSKSGFKRIDESYKAVDCVDLIATKSPNLFSGQVAV